MRATRDCHLGTGRTPRLSRIDAGYLLTALRFSMIAVAFGDAFGLEAQTGRVFQWSSGTRVPTVLWP